jgi:probable F420-dependent oxidoreductase
MDFGVILPNYGPEGSHENILVTARAAERLGYHSIWTTDHVLIPRGDAARFENIFECIATLAYLAGLTSRVRLGISSLVLPLRNPVIVAKQIAALDVLCSGRSMLCVSAGWSAGEFANLGERFDDRGRRLNEAIQVLRLLWDGDGGEQKTFTGEHYQFKQGVFSPAPHQPGGPPIWIGGNSGAAIRRAAKLGDGWHPSGIGIEDLRRGVARLRDLAGSRQVTISLRTRLSFDASHPSAYIKGSPQQITEELMRFAEAGLEHLVVTFMERDQAARELAMEQFAQDVIPALSGASS